MSGTTTTRHSETIRSELDAAKAKLAELRGKAEADQIKVNSSAARVENAKLIWLKERGPEEPFDPDAFNPPMTVYSGNTQLHRDHHSQHYVIASLEQELSEAAWSEGYTPPSE